MIKSKVLLRAILIVGVGAISVSASANTHFYFSSIFSFSNGKNLSIDEVDELVNAAMELYKQKKI